MADDNDSDDMQTMNDPAQQEEAKPQSMTDPAPMAEKSSGLTGDGSAAASFNDRFNAAKSGTKKNDDSKEGQNPHGFMDFMLQFMKANPDLAREMSTRMNAVINGQKLQSMKTQDRMPQGGPPPAIPGSAPRMDPSMMNYGDSFKLSQGGDQPPAAPPMQLAGDVVPLPGDRSMGPPQYQPAGAAAPYATGDQIAPNVQSIGQPTLQQWLTNQRARQG